MRKRNLWNGSAKAEQRRVQKQHGETEYSCGKDTLGIKTKEVVSLPCILGTDGRTDTAIHEISPDSMRQLSEDGANHDAHAAASPAPCQCARHGSLMLAACLRWLIVFFAVTLLVCSQLRL